MPYKSEAQRKYFNANREKLEAEGVDVDEWNESSKGKKLPEKAESSKEKAAGLLNDLLGRPFDRAKEEQEEQEKLDKAVARNMRERIARQIAKEKTASPVEELGKQAGLFYRDLDKPRSIQSIGQEVKDATKDVMPFGEENEGTGNFTQIMLNQVRAREPRMLTKLWAPRADDIYKTLVDKMDDLAGSDDEEGRALATDPVNRAVLAEEVLERLGSPQFASADDYKDEELSSTGDALDIYSYDDKGNAMSMPSEVARENALDLDDDKVMEALHVTTKPRSKKQLKKEAMFGTLLGGPIGAGLGARKARKEGRPMGHGAEEGFLRGMLTGGGAGIGTSLGLLGTAALMKGKPSTGKGVLAALLPLLGAGVGGYTGFRTGKPVVDQFRASRQELQDAVDEAKEDSDISYEEAKMDRMESEIENLAKAAAWQEKRALGYRAGKRLWDFGSKLLKKPVGGAVGRAGDSAMDFLKFRKGVDPAQVGGFVAGSVGDLAFDDEAKLWDPEESTGHNIENLWRRGFTGLAAGSVANPYRLGKKVRTGAKANLATKNRKLQEAFGRGKGFDKQLAPDMGDYAWALGKDTLPKATALGIGYAPGMIMSTGELPDKIRNISENLESVTGELEEATKGKGGIASSLKGTGQEVQKRINDMGKVLKDVRENITGENASAPELLRALKGTAEEATGTIGESGSALKDIASAGTAIKGLAENLPTKPDIEGYGKKIDERLTDISGGASERADAWGQRADAVGEAVQKWAPWVGGGLLAGGGLYGLYKIMESRRKAKEEEKRERQRMLYARPDAYPRLKSAGVEYFRRNMQ